jgi:hypothetical protein
VLVHAATRGVFSLDGYLEERTQRRRRVQLDVSEVTELPQCELVEELFASLRSCHVRRETAVYGEHAREGGVVYQVQPLGMLDQGQTPVQVDDAHEHGLLDDLRQVCRTSQHGVYAADETPLPWWRAFVTSSRRPSTDTREHAASSIGLSFAADMGVGALSTSIGASRPPPAAGVRGVPLWLREGKEGSISSSVRSRVDVRTLC